MGHLAASIAAADAATLSVRNLTVNLPDGMERAHAVSGISFDLLEGQILCEVAPEFRSS